MIILRLTDIRTGQRHAIARSDTLEEMESLLKTNCAAESYQDGPHRKFFIPGVLEWYNPPDEPRCLSLMDCPGEDQYVEILRMQYRGFISTLPDIKDIQHGYDR